MISRRSFIKSSLILGGVISTGAVFYSQIPLDEITQELKNSKLKFLNQNDIVVLLAIIPVLLSGANFNPTKIITVIQNIDDNIQVLSMKSQSELRDLFDLLSSKLGRALMAGIWSSWSHASKPELVKFLIDWQNSFFDLFQVGYQGLKQLVVANYYAEEDSWSQIGYDGPPVLF